MTERVLTDRGRTLEGLELRNGMRQDDGNENENAEYGGGDLPRPPRGRRQPSTELHQPEPQERRQHTGDTDHQRRLVTLVHADSGVDVAVDERLLRHEHRDGDRTCGAGYHESSESSPPSRREHDEDDDRDACSRERATRSGEIHHRGEDRQRQRRQGTREPRPPGSHERKQQRIRERDLDPQSVPVAEREAEPVLECRHDRGPRLQAEGAREAATHERDDGHGNESQGHSADEHPGRHEPRHDDGDGEYGDVERDLVELRERAFAVRGPAGGDQNPDGERRKQAERENCQPVDARPGGRDAERCADSQQPPGRHARVRPCRRRKAAVRVRERENRGRNPYSYSRVTEKRTLPSLYLFSHQGSLQ